MSGSQILDAGASSGVTSVQFEITGGILNNDVSRPPRDPEHLRLAGQLEYDSGAQWHLHAAERCCLWRRRERDKFRHHDHRGQQPSEHPVGIPSSGATVSGSQKLDASASSGVTSVQYEITGGNLEQ